jgi:hypothetical protein
MTAQGRLTHMRKNKLFTLIIIVFVCTPALSQTRKDIFNPNVPILWLGLDFSSVRIIGEKRIHSISELHQRIAAWNDLLLTERAKYDIGKALHRGYLKDSIAITKAHNEGADLTEALTKSQDRFYHLGAASTQGIISSYDLGANKGIGLIFIVEGFNFSGNIASVWVTFFKMETKEVLLTQRITSEPEGMNIRNYWANAIYRVMLNINYNIYEEWVKKYD